MKVNLGEPLDVLAPSVLAAGAVALGIDAGADAARWLAGEALLLHELGHAMLGHARGQGPRDRQEAEATAYALRAARELSADCTITEEEAAEALERIGAEMARERAPAPAH